MILMFLHKTGWFWHLLHLQLLEKVVNFRNLYWYSWKSFGEASIQTRIDESYLVDFRRQEQSWWSVIVWSREVKEKIWKQKWTAREDLLRKSWEFETGGGSWEVQTNIRFSRSSPLGTFRAEKRLQHSDRNSILMMQINVYIINPEAMGFQI